MTFTEIRDEIAARLNLSSTEAETRIGRAVNRAYRAVTTAIGLDTSRRTNVTADTTEGVQTITFTGIEKVQSVWDPSSGANRVLEQVTHAELVNLTPAASDAVTRYAVTRMNAGSVTVTLDVLPQSVFTLHGQGLERADTLSGSQEPGFPESFRDILIEGVLADEYRKAEKPTLAQMSKETYDQRLSELRMFIAKSNSLRIRQGDRKGGALSGAASGGGTAPNGGTSYTQTGLITFDRDPGAPFAVTADSAKVTNLDADLLDGEDGSYYTDATIWTLARFQTPAFRQRSRPSVAPI